MAIPADISELISGTTVESTRIEFKSDFNPEPIIHTICAFANDIDNIGGGYIIIGIEEKDSIPQLPPKGIDKSRIDSILKKLEGFCHCIEPLYKPIVEPKLLDGRYIIAIWCPGGFGRPYKAAKNVYKNTSDKRYYIRKMASTVVASPQEERELFYVSSDIPFDDRPNLTASVEALSRNRIQDYLHEVGSALYNRSKDMSLEALAEDLQLLAGPPEDLHPRNVGILMFSDHIEQYFKYARIEVVNLPDPTGKDMTEKVSKGQYRLSSATLSSSSRTTSLQARQTSCPIRPKPSLSGIIPMPPSKRFSRMRYTTAHTRYPSPSLYASHPNPWKSPAIPALTGASRMPILPRGTYNHASIGIVALAIS